MTTITIEAEINGEWVTATGDAWTDEGPEGVRGTAAMVDGDWPDDVRLQLEGLLCAVYDGIAWR